MSCGTALEARRNSDERWTFTPSSRNYTFSGMAPLFTVRRGETVLLQIDQTQTINGSLFSVVGDSVVLQLKKGDAALLDSPTPDTDAEALFYDVTLTDQTGFENWIVGGPFTLLGLNDVSCGGCSEKVEVTLGGQCIQVNIEGGNLGIGAYIGLSALAQAVQDAQASAQEAEQAAANAELVVIDKADRTGDNLNDTDVSSFREAIGVSFESKAAAEAARISVAIFRVSLEGYWFSGDGGAADYKRVMAQPSHSGKFQDALGQWWELDVLESTPQMFGATADGISDCTDAIQAAIIYGQPLYFPRGTYLCGPVAVGRKSKLRGTTDSVIKIRPGTIKLFNVGIGDDVTFEDLIFECSGMIAEQGNGVIVVVNTKNLLVRGCVAYNIPKDQGQSMHFMTITIGIARNNSATIIGNKVWGCGGDAIQCNSGNFNVVGNFLYDVHDGGVAFNNRCEGVITGNIFWYNRIGVGSGPQASVGVPDGKMSITGNKFHQCRTGVMMGHFDKPGRQGPTSVSITGNTFVDTRECHIMYYGTATSSGGTEKDLVISGNVFGNCGENTMSWDGIDRHAIELSNISGVVIDGNIFDVGPLYAIWIRGRTDAQIVGNRVKEFTGFINSTVPFYESDNYVEVSGAIYGGGGPGPMGGMGADGFLRLAGARSVGVLTLQGMTDSNGDIEMAHGVFGLNNRILHSQATVRGNSLEAIPLAFDQCGATNIRFTALSGAGKTQPNKECTISVLYTKNSLY